MGQILALTDSTVPTPKVLASCILDKAGNKLNNLGTLEPGG